MRSAGSGGVNLGRSFFSTPNGTVTTTCDPTSVFPDSDVTTMPPSDVSTRATGQSRRTSSPAAIASTTEA